MPRSRGSEMPQRQSPRAPLQLRTSSSESDGVHSTMTNRATVDRSPKLGDRRSPRNPVVEKKRGTRVSDLESQLGVAQDELKKLKEQLASAEAAKREAQEELEKAKKQIPAEDPPEIHEPIEQNGEDVSSPQKLPEDGNPIEENSPETDVFEVSVMIMPVEPNVELVHNAEEEIYETRPIEESSEPLPELEKLSNLSENAEISELKSKLEEKEKELESLHIENEDLKRQVSEAVAEAAAARVKEEESALKLRNMEGELEERKSCSAQLVEELKATEAAKLALEAEVKKMKVQTEQWRKAADAAAAVLAGGVEMNGRVPERCGSMDKHIGGFEYTGYGSPMADELDDGMGNGKRKGAGIRMFGDLWKKKGQK
ncbi:interactor of constitutive active ROPs 4-like protein [Cinnamomum micranthum f. kanehirae]|uniref:Interactor of constitutive active ROPs 4-like protein n=1 Tax=Cinnamomum micranthum f. kanehirae TaxID=337451 RepID=A0A3S3NBV1_9MAGN|nr:interactor of constitutive active ROPs 4-like protein [Cinnamomum micranthum f. kanehirae]